MDVIDALFRFEKKYPFLYDEMVGGIAVYTCLRDDVAARLTGQTQTQAPNVPHEKGRIYLRRVIDTFVKWRRNQRRTTLIFTSSVYRRDYGRNLSAEYLIQHYPDAVCFEWPSRNDAFDCAYFSDQSNYVPLDGYVVWFKIYALLHRNEIQRIEALCRTRLQAQFQNKVAENDMERNAILYLIDTLPRSVAATMIHQRLFRRLFHNYHNIQYAVDYWGSARENIIPVLPGKPQSIELQHGLITASHPGYVYPKFVSHSESTLFDRKILVYGNHTKEILCTGSVYTPEQIEVVGNPRIQMYKSISPQNNEPKKWVLFSSQTFEQDGTGSGYYASMLPILKQVNDRLNRIGKYRLAVKLHPREGNEHRIRYQEELPGASIFSSEAGLYDLLCQSYFHLTATSTVLLEAAEFDVPTAVIQYQDYTPQNVYGFDVTCLNCDEGINLFFQLLNDPGQYSRYLEELKRQVKNSM